MAVKVVQWEERYMPGLPAPPYMMERLVNERPEAEIAEERKRVDEWLHRKDNWQPVETPDSSAPAPNPPKN